jgi:hypothetical protein
MFHPKISSKMDEKELSVHNIFPAMGIMELRKQYQGISDAMQMPLDYWAGTFSHLPEPPFKGQSTILAPSRATTWASIVPESPFKGQSTILAPSRATTWASIVPESPFKGQSTILAPSRASILPEPPFKGLLSRDRIEKIQNEKKFHEKTRIEKVENELMELKEILKDAFGHSKPNAIKAKTMPMSVEPLRWNGTCQSLYFLFHLLKVAKKVKGDTEIAKFIISNYQKTDGTRYEVKEIENIRKQINDPAPLNSKDRKIAHIIEKAIADIDKTLKIN